MSITHVFFDLHGTLIDTVRLHPCYSMQLGQAMAERYGLTAEVWRDANRRIVADWDSYYADLDLGGDEGIADMWEGMLRTTRALFRLTGVAEPDMATLTALSRELPELATRRCDALYPEVKGVIARLHQSGLILGVASHAITAHIRGVLTGGAVDAHFTGPLMGPDITGSYHKNHSFFSLACIKARAVPSRCLVVDDSASAIREAKAAGLQTAFIWRKDDAPPSTAADYVLQGDLCGLLTCLGVHDD